MKHKLFTLFLALVAGVGTTFAESGTCGTNLTWDLTNGVLTISGTGNMKDYAGTATDSPPWWPKTIRSSIKQISIGNGVTSIGGRAFFDCTNLTSITIPESVTSIGEYAFYQCTGLTSIEIPNSVDSIKDRAFDCSGLTMITIPSGVTFIGSFVFSGCSSLPVEDNIRYADSYLVGAVNKTLSSYTIRDGTRFIGTDAFYNCTDLTSITIPERVTSIGEYAFYQCTGLTSVTIETATPPELKGEAFRKCTSLKAIYVPCGASEAYKSAWSEYASLIKYTPAPSLQLFVNIEDAGKASHPENLSICSGRAIPIEAVPNYGYHFVKWSDGIMDNPRTIELTRDTTFTAEFAKNTYSITTEVNNSEWGTTAGDGAALYQEQLQISATPNYGYHFVQWNDGNTENPRSVVLTQDTTFTVTFAKNVYSITKVANSTQGAVSGTSQAEYLDYVTLNAVPNYGYHFVKWSDGVTDNPRTIVLTQDTTFIAEFAKNEYTITTESNNSVCGTTAGDTTALYLDEVSISATPNYGYHFVRWNDNNTSNPRTVTITENKTYQAIFAKNVYSITKVANSTQGAITGNSSAEYLDNVKLTAVPNYGYHFTQWSDGLTDNPRTIELTRDTTFTAEFALDRTGKCGNDSLLTWTYEPEKKVLSIEGNGAFVENIQCGVEARSILEKVIIGKGVTAIKANAFADCPNLTTVEWNATNGGDCSACPLPSSVTSVTFSDGVEHIPAYICNGLTGIASIIIPSSVKSIGDYAFANINSRKISNLVLPSEIISIGDYAFAGNTYIEQIDFGKSLESIGAYAFQGCTRVMTMTCLAEMTPDVETDGLASISSNADLYVLSSALKKYQVDPNWSRFLLKELGATETTTTDKNVTVTTDENTATFTWPTDDNAASYTIQITKDGELVCTLIFNANGQLTGIAFAPSHNGSHQAPAAIMANNAAQFTVTGLNSASKYGYRLAVTNENQEELVVYSGEFATTGYEGEVNPGGEPEYNPQAIDQIDFSSLQGGDRGRLILRDGQIFILRGDKTYTVTGQEIR